MLSVILNAAAVLAVSLNKTIPLVVIPVAAAMAPLELTWNWADEPTLKSEVAVVEPILTLPPPMTKFAELSRLSPRLF